MACWSKEEIEIVGGTKVSAQMPIIVPLDDVYSADRALTKTAQGTAPRTMEKGNDKTVVKKEDEIVAILADNPSATRQQLAKATGLTVRGVEWILKGLKDSGRIRRVGPTKGGHWEVVE